MEDFSSSGFYFLFSRGKNKNLIWHILGIVAKQTIKGSVWSYLGALIGAVNVAILMPRFFSEEQIGLTSILITFSVMFSQFSSLGVQGVTNFFFPLFRNPVKKHNGFFTLMNIITFAGFVLFSIVYFLLKDAIVASKADNSLLVSNSFYILPLTFFTLLFLVYDNYNTILYDSVTGVFLKEFLFRILNLVIVIFYFFELVSFDAFIFLYVFSLSLPGILMFIILLSRGEASLKSINLSIFNKHKKEIISVALFSLISGFGVMSVSYIDKYMTNYYLGLAVTGIYTIASYISSLIQIPARSMTKILTPIISENWRSGNNSQLQSIYLKSNLVQFLAGSFIFLLIWINIDIVFLIIPEQYSAGKYVVLLIGLANVVNSFGGSGQIVLQVSDGYKYATYFIFILLAITVIANIILIPPLGIIGASIGTLFATLGYVSLKILFLKRRYGLVTFDKNHLFGFLFFVIALLGAEFIDPFQNVILNDIFKTLILLLVSAFLLLYTNLLVDKKITKEYMHKALSFFARQKDVNN